MKLEKASSDTKRQEASDVSVQELNAELTKVKAKLVEMTAERLESSTKLGAVAAECNKRLEEFAVARNARDRVKGLVRSIVD